MVELHCGEHLLPMGGGVFVLFINNEVDNSVIVRKVALSSRIVLAWLSACTET